MRHYGRRPAALWDALAPDALDETVARFERSGLKPYLLIEDWLIEDWEEAGFRERFAGEMLEDSTGVPRLRSATTSPFVCTIQASVGSDFPHRRG